MIQLDGILGSLVRGALGARAKPHNQVARFLGGGNKSFLNTGTILTAAALGFGAYEIWRTRGGGSTANATIGGSGPLSPDSLPANVMPTRPSLPPPLPGSRSSVEVVANTSDGLPRIAALLVSAARSDGELGEAEYARILSEARAAGADKGVLQELSNPRPLEAIVAGVNDSKLASDLYTLAFAVVRADSSVNPAERAWLDRLSTLLRLDRNSVERLEKAAAQSIARAT